MKTLKINGKTIRYSEYKSRRTANVALDNAIGYQRLMLGDNGAYWIVKPADADRLERAGYEYAR
jgi:hypothetical protein